MKIIFKERMKIIRLIRYFLDLLGIDPGKRQNLFKALSLITRIFAGTGNDFLRTDSEFRLYSSFSKYLYNDTLLKQKTDVLKKNLDAESCRLIDKLLNRYKYLFSNSIINNDLFDEEEKREQKNIKWNQIKKRYPSFINGCISTYKYHSGLKILPKEILDNFENKAVIDAGAYDGDSALVFRMNYKFGDIFSFEPLKENFLYLEKNIKNLHLNAVFPMNKGLGDKNMKCGIVNNGAGSFISKVNGLEKTELITIDEFANERKLDVCLIKMDIEGFELKALQGAVETIKKNKPVLLISIYHSGEDFFEIKPFIESLCSDYIFKIIKTDPHELVSETTLVGWVMRIY